MYNILVRPLLMAAMMTHVDYLSRFISADAGLFSCERAGDPPASLSWKLIFMQQSCSPHGEESDESEKTDTHA
jgi:hypothetical protein